MLLLFKPFTCLSDLCDGMNWDECYEKTNFGIYRRYIESIEEMHIGLQERQDDRDDDESGVEDSDTVEDTVFFLYGFSCSGYWDSEVEHINLFNIISHEHTHSTTHTDSQQSTTSN